MIKTSIRFFENIPVRAIWDEESSKWWFSATDIIEALTKSKDPRVYWSTLKHRKFQLFTDCKQLKLTARDGKKYFTDVISEEEVDKLIAIISNKNSLAFEKWLNEATFSIDEKSKLKAYELYESGIIDDIEVGTVKGLKQIHSYIFGGLFDFAGKIRTLNISKGGFAFAPVMFLKENLAQVEKMHEDTLEHIINKYVEMNIAHPFMEGNGRATRIWLDLILKKNLKTCTDRSKIDKNKYFDAMRKSPVDSKEIFSLIKNAQTTKINDKEIYIKGIDYSYYYEENE
ncbi:MAG: Fic family protein [Firmicutes bacterium]|uniref:protein adenylyltransferase n=1 Tax=Candidatus Onthovivens merdipullorum TaxID=2840889 RepID=A0A9D9DM57_9BACL|nr:Fic family protein [Candidatus Onthovivens merdipullorum]